MLVYLPAQTTHTEADYVPPPVIEEVEVVKDAEETYPGEECNCYLYVKNRVDDLPRMHEITPNAGSTVGSIAVEWYGEVKHISIVTEVMDDGVWVEESNYSHCKTGTRFIPFNKHSLSGFWSS